MEMAERIAIREHCSERIAVISGVGTRNYYRKLGYHLEGPYMVKSLVPGEYRSVFDWVDEKPPPSKVKISIPGYIKPLTVDEHIHLLTKDWVS